MVTLTRLRSSSELRKKRRRHSHRHHHHHHHYQPQQQTPTLIVDVRQPEAHWLWSLFGLVIVSVQSIICIYNPVNPTPWIGIGVAALATLAGLLTRTLPPPRPHPAFLPAMLIVLGMPLVRMMTGAQFLNAFSEPFLYGITLIWIFAWLVRARWAVYSSGLAFVLLLEFYLAIRLPGGVWTTTPLFSHTEGVASLLWQGGIEYRLLLLLVLISLIALITQGRIERRRWEKQRLMRFMMYSTVFLGVAGLAGAMIVPQYVPVDSMAVLGFCFGISIASRQRLIADDPTRHPPSQLTPVKSHFVELGIGLQSVVSSITGGGSGVTGTRDDRRSRFIDPKSTVIYNPYNNELPSWVPVALHIHSNRWEGKFRPEVVVDHFHRLGASSVILTDHNRITQSKHPFQNIVAYEHGWGPHNNHVLVLGAHKRLPEASMFGGTVKDRGKTLSRLRGVSEFTILAHPRLKGAWSSDDVTRHDYDALEIFNRAIDSYRRWDEALSSGMLVWATSGDDCHDIRSRHQTGKRFLLVDLGELAPRPGEAADAQLVLEALKAGRYLSIRHMSRNVTREIPHPNLPKVERFHFDGENLRINFNKRIDSIKVYGPFRTRKATLTRQDEVTIGPRDGEGFVRIVAEHGPFLIVFNPVARVSGLEYGV